MKYMHLLLNLYTHARMHDQIMPQLIIVFVRPNCNSARCLAVLQFTKLIIFNFVAFYRAMHYSAKRGIAIACRRSV